MREKKYTSENVARQNVGIDVAQGDFKAALSILTTGHDSKAIFQKRFSNDLKGFNELLQWVENKEIKGVEITFTMEATGVYYENLAYYLHEKAKIVHVMLPNRAKKYAESLESKSKTDKLDAKALGRLGVERKLRRWKPFSDKMRTLKFLTRERNEWIRNKTRVSNQIHALESAHEVNKEVLARYKSQLKHLEKLIAKVEASMEAQMKDDPELTKKVAKIATTPGIGWKTAITVIAETDGFALINNIKQLQSFAGFDVMLSESGKHKGKARISKKGNTRIRAALFGPAMAMLRCNPTYKAFYQRLKENGKPSMVGLTALQRKILGLIYALWKTDSEYNPEYNTRKEMVSGIA